MLAFSTISHSGLILAGISLFDGKATAGAGIYLIGHGMAKAALFICAGILIHRLSSVDEIDLKGKGRELKWTALLVVIGALALCGIPPFATFTGKALIDESAAHSTHQWLPVILAITSALTAATVLRMAGRVFMGLGDVEDGEEPTSPTEHKEHKETDSAHNRTPLIMLSPAAFLLIACIVIAHLPGLKEQALISGNAFQSANTYSNMVLHGTKIAQNRITAPIEPTLQSYTYSLISFLIAAGICFLSLFRRAIPVALRKAWSSICKPCTEMFMYLHSGHVGDYVLWQMLGLAVIGIAIMSVSR